jgi:hypothetical protein
MNSDEHLDIERLRRTLEEEIDTLSNAERSKVVARLKRQFSAANEPISVPMEAAFAQFAAGETRYRHLQAQLGESLNRALFPRGTNGDV